MVIALIPVIVKIGQVVHKIVSSGKYFPKTAKELVRQDVASGVVSGGGFGAFVASVVDHYSQEETVGNLVGLPEKTVQQRNDNRFSKTRSALFKSARSRRFCKGYNNRNR